MQIGFGTPTGYYANSTYNLTGVGTAYSPGFFGSECGFAEVGLTYKLDIGCYSRSAVGFLASVGGGYNSFDSRTLGTSLAVLIPNPSGTPLIGVTVNKAIWSYQGLLGGIYLRLPHKNSPVYLKAQAGYYTANSPQLSIKYQVPWFPSPIILAREAVSSGAIAYCFGAGAHIALRSNLLISFCVDFLTFRPSFNIPVSVTTSPATLSSGMPPANDVFIQNINVFTLSAGLVLAIK